MKKQTSERGKAWIKTEMRPYRASVLFLCVLAVLTSVLSVLFAYLIRYLINSATNGEKNLLIFFAVLLLGLLLVKIALQAFTSFFSERTRARIVANLRTKTFASLLRSDFSKVSEYHSGELMSRITADVNEISSDTVGLTPSVVGLIVQCVSAITALLTLDPLFTAIYVICGLLGGGISAAFKKQIKKRQREFLEADAKSRSYMQENFSSVLTIKAYIAESRSEEKAGTLAQEYYAKRIKRSILRTGMSTVFMLLSNAGLIFAVVWCSIGLLSGTLFDFGSVLSIVLLLNQLQHPFSAFSSIIPVYYSRMTSAERLCDLYDLPKEEVGVESQAASYDDFHSFSLNDVSFSYGREVVLENVNCEIKKGEIVCITGASGSGKSTLFKMLLSVYKATKGEVLINLNDTSRALTVADRALFAYVPQGNFLFSGTIYENLTFFSKVEDESVMREKVDLALRLACADFVFELPDGVNTSLSERGGGLSEGQLQRLAIARAFLSERPILLFDEATSALDGETERMVIENIAMMKNKTCILVTHRPAALSIADCVLDIKDGTINKVK